MTKALGTLADIAGTPPQNDPDARITDLERRITNLEALVNSIVHQLDKPDKPQGRKREQFEPFTSGSRRDGKRMACRGLHC